MDWARQAQPFATLLPDGRVLLSGGEDATGKPYVSGEVYDPNPSFHAVADLRRLYLQKLEKSNRLAEMVQLMLL